MEFIGIIIGMALMIFIVNIICHDGDEKDCKALLSVNTFLWFVVFIFALIAIHNCIPTALDVYRGNTELKIHSVNGIPTDTIVVYKKK